MTFIASVIASKGVAIVADSFVTTPVRSIEAEDFAEYIKTKKGNSIKLEDIIKQFKKKTGYTRNYAEKLFRFDDYTAITTAGKAYINDKPVKEIVRQMAATWVATEKYTDLPIDVKLTHIKNALEIEVKEHINKYNFIDETVLIYSHYNLQLDKPEVFKISAQATTKKEIDEGKADFVSSSDQTMFGIVTDGQDYIIDRFLFGSIYRYDQLAPQIVADRIFKELKCKKATRLKIIDILNKENVLLDLIKREFKIVNIRPLSLQEATDLAVLLLRIVMDIQVYTEKIPTVGGDIKLVVIGKEVPFKWIAGNDIIKPKLIY